MWLCSHDRTPFHGDGQLQGYTRRPRHTAANSPVHALRSGLQRFGSLKRSQNADFSHGWPFTARYSRRTIWRFADGLTIPFANCAEFTLNRHDTCFLSVPSRRRCERRSLTGTVPLELHHLLWGMTLMDGGTACWPGSRRRRGERLAETSSTPCGDVGRSGTEGCLETPRSNRTWLPTL